MGYETVNYLSLLKISKQLETTNALLEELRDYLVPSREAAPLPEVIPDNVIVLPKRETPEDNGPDVA